MEYMPAGRPVMPQWWEGRDMLAELAAPAIAECTTAAENMFHVPAGAVPVVVLLPPPERPCRWPQLEAAIMDDLARKLGRPLAQGSAVVAEGRTGFVRALAIASDLAYGARMGCVIAGVESFLRQAIVNHYIGEGRLRTAANSNGFSPGEAAAAVLVAPADASRGPELVLRGVGWARDPSGAGGTAARPATGDGLTEATRHALQRARWDFRDLDLRISDANGEHWKMKEVVFSSTRLDRLRPSGAPPRRFGMLDHWHPIEFVGEVGAAIFPLILGWALHAGVNRYLHGPRVLLHAAEDAGDRAAVVAEYRAGVARGSP
jgi:3-oxoacyl-[acyl-carrier-protein] synthase-1